MTAKTVRPPTRDAIIEAAIALFAEDRSATTSEIAIRAGVGRATLHRHFRDRDELIAAIETQCMDETERAVLEHVDPKSSAVQRLRGVFVAMVPFGGHYHFLSHTYSDDENNRQRYQRELKWVEALVDDLRAEGALRDDVSTAWVVAQMDQLVWTAWREVAQGRLASADAPELALQTLLKGLGN